ncbi:hypothetical protein [Micromonospora chersina]|uniref:hypothetical protein n=1 Tax=Micromonospora chersina TaxID=47854 RepID=UPI0033A059F4
MTTPTGEVVRDAVPDGEQGIIPWEKTDEALGAAAELMPACEIEHDGIGEDGQPIEDRQTVESIVGADQAETGDA